MRARDNRTQPSLVWAIGPIVAFALVLIGSIIQWTSERVDVSNVVPVVFTGTVAAAFVHQWRRPRPADERSPGVGVICLGGPGSSC